MHRVGIMAKKHAIENINDVDGPIPSTGVHGAIMSLSPVKEGSLF